MTWFKVDDSSAFHEKIVAAGPALALWTRAGAWCAQQLTDGRVPDHLLPLLGGTSSAKKLVAVGLWHAPGHTCEDCAQPVAGSHIFHDWDAYQPTRDEVEEKREKRARAGKLGGQQSGSVRRKRSKREANTEANASAKPKQHGSTVANPRPDPTFQVLTEPAEPAASAGPLHPDEVETIDQRAQRLSKIHKERQPMSRFPATLGIVKQAIKAGKTDTEISNALIRIADEGRTLTVESLRIEIEGFNPRASSGQKPSTSDQRRADVRATADRIKARLGDTNQPPALGGAA